MVISLSISAWILSANFQKDSLILRLSFEKRCKTYAQEIHISKHLKKCLKSKCLWIVQLLQSSYHLFKKVLTKIETSVFFENQ